MKNETTSVPVLLTRQQVADALGVKKNTVAGWATKGRMNLPFVKFGRIVMYRLVDLNKFIESSLVTKGGAVR